MLKKKLQSYMFQHSIKTGPFMDMLKSIISIQYKSGKELIQLET